FTCHICCHPRSLHSFPTRRSSDLLISVALLGWAPRGKAVLRSGAEVGDAIFVTGELGGSLAAKHLEFQPRLAEARWLAQHFSLRDRKSTRLNSSHLGISYAVFCLK